MRSIASRRWCHSLVRHSETEVVTRPSVAKGLTVEEVKAAALRERPSELGFLRNDKHVTVAGIKFKGSVEDDLAMPYTPQVQRMWSNVPTNIRMSMKTNIATLDQVERPPNSSVKEFVGNARETLASWGLAASFKQVVEYPAEIRLEPYKKGQTAAYAWPNILIPRHLAYRFPMDAYFDPVFQTSAAALVWQQRPTTLFHKLQGKCTMILLFSGQPLSGLYTGVEQWTQKNVRPFLEHPNTQLLRIHTDNSWLSRRTHQLTKFLLRRQVSEDDQFNTFVYRGKFTPEFVKVLHLHNRELPTILLVDKRGYIRWHAIGLPSEEATEMLRSVALRLTKEKI